MLQTYRSSPKKYRIYLSSTSKDFPELRQALIKRLLKAGLLCTYLEFIPPNQKALEKKIVQELESIDIVILLVKDSLGSHKLHRKNLIQVEFEYAQTIGKPILAYFSDQGEYGSFSAEAREFKSKVIEKGKYGRIINSAQDMASTILGDILNLITSEPGLSYWVRSDLNHVEINSIASQKDEMDKNMLLISQLISEHERRLNQRDKDRLVGPLIDCGLRRNLTGQAYRFAVGVDPQGELNRNNMQYEYCIERFLPMDNGMVYDRKLKLVWFTVPEHNFTWPAAMEWQDNLDSDILEILEKMTSVVKTDGKLSDWRLPTIEELMTVITYSRSNDAYLDEKIFPNKIYWFWSSTVVDKEYSYYIESSRGQVLKDKQHHRKGLLLCLEGQIAKAETAIPPVFIPPVETGLKDLRQVNLSNRVYSVYLSSFSSTLINPETVDLIRSTLLSAGFSLSTFNELGAISGIGIDAIQKEMEKTDYHVLVLDRGAINLLDPNSGKQIRKEIQISGNLGLPISLLHNLDEDDLVTVCKSLDLNLETVETSSYVSDTRTLLFELSASLQHQQKTNPRPGWIQKEVFETINRSILNVNNNIEKLVSCEAALEAFIQHFNTRNLREVFKSYGVISEKPKFGEHIWFASSNNPIQRFFYQSDEIRESDFPIIFTKIPDRFTPVTQNGKSPIVFDRYLNLKWWTEARKHVTLEESQAFAQEISEAQQEEWRLPTVNEMVTLITRIRGKRKYMDEIVFPLGRWFWTATRYGRSLVYVDFNYLYGAVGREDLLPGEICPDIRKKSVILVSGRSDEDLNPRMGTTDEMEEEELLSDYHPTGYPNYSSEKQAEGSQMYNKLLQKELETCKENLRLIQLRISEYVMSTEVPLQLVKEREKLEHRIAELDGQLKKR